MCFVASLSWLKMEEKGKVCQLIAGLMEKFEFAQTKSN